LRLDELRRSASRKEADAMDMVVTNVLLPSGKHGRICYPTGANSESTVIRFKELFEDEDDELRWPHLKSLIESGHVVARVHPSSGLGAEDIMQIFLYAHDDAKESTPFFACSMAAWSRVEKDVASGDAVLETSTFQLVDSAERLRATGDEERIKVGLLAWVARVFPGVAPPREIEIKPYNNATPCGWAYAQFTDDEEWYGLFETRDEAILEGFEECTEEKQFYIAKARWNRVDDGLDADHIIDQLLDHVGDNSGDFAQEAIEARLTDIARVELDTFLFTWAKKHLSELYWTVDSPREEIVRAHVPSMNLSRPTQPK
jgi:hypothetical protein